MDAVRPLLLVAHRSQEIDSEFPPKPTLEGFLVWLIVNPAAKNLVRVSEDLRPSTSFIFL